MVNRIIEMCNNNNTNIIGFLLLIRNHSGYQNSSHHIQLIYQDSRVSVHDQFCDQTNWLGDSKCLLNEYFQIGSPLYLTCSEAIPDNFVISWTCMLRMTRQVFIVSSSIICWIATIYSLNFALYSLFWTKCDTEITSIINFFLNSTVKQFYKWNTVGI